MPIINLAHINFKDNIQVIPSVMQIWPKYSKWCLKWKVNSTPAAQYLVFKFQIKFYQLWLVLSKQLYQPIGNFWYWYARNLHFHLELRWASQFRIVTEYWIITHTHTKTPKVNSLAHSRHSFCFNRILPLKPIPLGENLLLW